MFFCTMVVCLTVIVSCRGVVPLDLRWSDVSPDKSTSVNHLCDSSIQHIGYSCQQGMMYMNGCGSGGRVSTEQ